ncbi:FitA-like ribbon-helix-helix domain-containing protein [Ruania alba]|uniref:FitA-like ribbon-helix-helix domain-containing protein n=1 Tax=Ruania alba TaxID=648782 RepID=UPI003CCBFF63
MPAITVRKLSDETHRALKARAARHGRSTEAEVRSIPEEATHPTEHEKVGSASRTRPCHSSKGEYSPSTKPQAHSSPRCGPTDAPAGVP